MRDKMEVLKEFKVGVVTVKIVPDDYGDHDCPIDKHLSKDGIMFVTFEKNSTLSDFHDFHDPDEVLPWAKANKWDAFPLRKYEHGSVGWSVANTGYPYNCPWDSGQVGWVLVKRSAFPRKNRCEIAESWCKAVTTWANGWYYGFIIENDDGDHLDSCWGYDDDTYCETEARSIAAHVSEREAEKIAAREEENRPDMYPS